MKYFVFSILLCINLFFYGQVSIDGNAPSFKGKYVSILQIEDYVTNTYKNHGRQKVDSLGKFSFKLAGDKAFKAIIEIEEITFDSMEFPGSNYDVYPTFKTY